MQLKIFHGDNQSVLLQKLGELLKRYESTAISRYSLKSETFEQILLSLATPTFFAEERVIVVDDAEEKKVLIDKIPEDADLTVILFFPKELTNSSKVLKEAAKKNAQIVAISEPQDKQIFTFLDLMAEKNTKAYSFFDQLYEQYGGQYLLTMITFQLRRLVMPSFFVPPFLKQKIELQQKKFTKESLTSFYYLTLETEFLIKNGRVEEKTALLLLVSKILS